MNHAGKNFPIVGLGASAGGLAALEGFFRALPATPGMAFVVVQHLSPDFKSVMGELLARFSTMESVRVEQDMEVRADTIYLIPPGMDMTLRGGRFHLQAREPMPPLHLPIDIFLNSLAEDVGERAVAVILSGTGGDGSRGVVSVSRAGGRVLAQTPDSAAFDGMPRAAIATNTAEYIGTPESLAKHLTGQAADESVPQMTEESSPADMESAVEELVRRLDLPEDAQQYAPVFARLSLSSGLDFTQYKLATVARRIERRMNMTRRRTLDDYCALLRESPEENTELFRDLLIGVTCFFRDPQAFEVLAEDVLPGLLAERASDEEELRLWVPGCATGEEPYSLAILMEELFARNNKPPCYRIFATDAYRGALETASHGVYSSSAMEEVSPERRERFFEETPSGWRISSALRRCVVFAEHNVLSDAPFTRIDLLSCRNMLIYFQPAAQERVLRLFHFALRKGGVLFQGPSESVAPHADAFTLVNRHWNIYIKKTDRHLQPLADQAAPGRMLFTTPAQLRSSRGIARDRATRLYLRLLDRFVPQGFMVTRQRELLHTFGDAGRFLLMRGQSTSDLVAMLQGDLRVAVSGALQRAIKHGEATSYERVRVDADDLRGYYRVSVEPIEEPSFGESVYFVSIASSDQAMLQPEAETEFSLDDAIKARIADLEKELQETRENLQTTVEELETSNEELQATNEELLASNEELQSTNEELQSVNEELYTVNAEYERNNEALAELNQDLTNLINCTNIGTVFVDPQMRIRKFTPSIYSSFHLRAQDIGRPLGEIAALLQNQDDLLEDIRRTLDTGVVAEREVNNMKGHPVLQRVHPYRDEHGAIKGAAITFVDLAHIKHLEEKRHASERLQTAILNSLAANVAVINAKGDIIAVNDSWRAFARDNEGPEFAGGLEEGANYFGACMCASDEEEYADAQNALAGLRAVLARRIPIFEMEYPCHAPDEERWFLMRVSPLDIPEGGAVIAHVNITRLKQMQQTVGEQESKYRSLFQNMPVGLLRCDRSGRVLDCNERMLAIAGFETSDAFQRHFNLFELSTADGRAMSGEVVAAQQGGAGLEVVWTDPAGRRRFFKVSVGAVPEAAVADSPWDISVTDITALTETLERLSEAQEQNRRLAAAVHAAAESIVVSDTNGTILYVNPAFERITGYRSEEAVGNTPRILKSGMQDQGFYSALWETIRAGEAWTGRFINRTKAGELFHAVGTISPITDAQGTITNFVSVMRDVTYEHTLEEQSRQSQKLEAIGTLAGGIAHDFNNILAGIEGYSDLALRKIPEDNDAREDLLHVIRATGRASELVRQILTFSRRNTEQPRALEAGILIKEALVLLRASTPANIEFDIDIAPDLGSVMADASQLHQVIVNLCTNACYAMRAEGGVLRVSLHQRAVDHRAAQALGLRPGPHLALCVQDTGPGIPEEVRERIFDPFFTTKGMEGTGMGLATVHGIVRNCNGAVRVLPVQPHGARFEVLMPVVQAAQAEPEPLPSEAPDASRGGGETILVVDDEPELVEVMTRVLTRHGYEARGHTSPADALAAVTEGPDRVAAVITDQTMPHMLGADLAQRMWEIRPGLPVILTSGYSNTVDEAKALEMGFTGYFPKPVRMLAMLRTLREALDEAARTAGSTTPD